MMPIVLRVGGFTFRFFSRDHEPAHVHVDYGGARCVVSLVDFTVRDEGMKRKDALRAVRIVKEHREMMLSAWNEYFARQQEGR